MSQNDSVVVAWGFPNGLRTWNNNWCILGEDKMKDFLFTVPSGEPVTIEPFHYAIVGQTQFSGKTTLIKRLAKWAVDQGFKILIFDTKETEADYAGFGQEVPICLRESTDSFVLIGLLESMFRRRLTPYYATLSRITEGAKGFDDIIGRAKEREEKTRSGWLKDACRVLYDLLERLKNETAKVDTVPRLKLYPGINRMVINDFSLEAQQLIVKNSFEDLLRIYKRKTIGILDEGHKFIPQGYSSPATRPVMHVMTQGGKTELYGWIATQFLAITDKGPLKACAFKFLGTQDHITEVKHTLDLIPEIRGKYTPDDIMKLKLGHWILVRKRPPDVRTVYSLPLGVSSWAGHNVAMGVVTPEQIRDKYLKPSRVQEDELMYKEKWEKEKRKRKEIEELNQRFREKINELEAKVEMLLSRGSPEKIKELRATIEKLKNDRTRLEKDLGRADAELERLYSLEKDADAIQQIKQALTHLLPTQPAGPPGLEPKAPSEINIVKQQPTITVETIRKPLSLTQDNLLGRIAIVYAEGQLPKDKWFTVTNVTKAFISHGWTKDPRTSKMLDQLCEWGYLEKHYAGKRPEYRMKMKPEEAKEKDLLKLIEK